MILILAQLALLLLTAWGWGFLLWKVCGAARAPGWQRHGWLFFGVGGFASCVLFLHILIYFDLPLKFTSWAGLLVAVMGAVGFFRRQSFRQVTMVRSRNREIVAASLLFTVVFGLQSIPLFHAGAENYYGSAHTDQVNYVLLGEFLSEKPLSTSLGDIGLQPWLAKPLTLKGTRIGQSVANGYLGVISMSDAKRAYGTLTIFMIAAGALGVFVLARVLAVSRILSMLTGFWWGILPAVTKIHLDGFLSQTCVLFVFPMIAAAFYVRRGRLERVPLVLLTLYLAYLLCAYTEVYVLGGGLLLCLIILAAAKGTSWKKRLAATVAITVGSLVLNGSYARNFFHYIGGQYEAAAANPPQLASIVPFSGTWIGWKQIFFGYQTFLDARLERLSLLVGFALVFFIGSAFQGRGLTRRRFLSAIIAPPAGVLVILLSAPEFPKYPFAKLLDTFTSFWLVFAVLGILYTGGLFARPRLLNRHVVSLLTVLLIMAAFYGSRRQWQDTCDDKGILAEVDSPTARLCYARAERDRRATYLIDEPHSLVCAWMAYAARYSQVYVDADQVTDLPVPAAAYAFRRLPQVLGPLVILDDGGPRAIDKPQRMPVLFVRNPQGTDGGGEDVAYWVGPDVALEVTDYSPPDDPARSFSLEFDAAAGPANPVPERSLALVSPEGSVQKLDFVASTRGRFEITVQPGKKVYTLKITYPTEQTNKLPLDPRDHMVQIRHFALVPSLPGASAKMIR